MTSELPKRFSLGIAFYSLNDHPHMLRLVFWAPILAFFMLGSIYVGNTLATFAISPDLIVSEFLADIRSFISLSVFS